MSNDDYRGGFIHYRKEETQFVSVVTDINFSPQPGAEYILRRHAEDPRGIFRITLNGTCICCYKARSKAKALKALPGVVEAITGYSRRAQVVELYPGELDDKEAVHKAMEELAKRHASTIRDVAKTVGTNDFQLIAEANNIAQTEGRKRLDDKRLQKEVERIYRSKDEREADRKAMGRIRSYRWKTVFLSRFVELKARYIQESNLTYWPWLVCELEPELREIGVEMPPIGTLKNYASKCGLKAPFKSQKSVTLVQ